MRVKAIVYESYQDYKKPSMFIATSMCDWKCCSEAGRDNSLCQNAQIAQGKSIVIDDLDLVKRYMDNPLTQAIVIGGLEPALQQDEVILFVGTLRQYTDDDVVIYSGYYPVEIPQFVDALSHYKNIVFKFGRFVPDKPKRYDDVLGVWLSSDNQFAERITSSTWH